MRKTLLLILTTVALAFQAPRPIPIYEGDSNPQHDGQPKWCQNFDTKAYKANCACKRDCSDAGSAEHRESGCKTYCRSTSCKCEHGCAKTE